MKFIAALTLFVAQIAVHGQGVLLNTGDSYIFDFAALTYVRPAGIFDGGSTLTVRFQNNLLDPGELIRFQCFQSFSPESPFGGFTLPPAVISETLRSFSVRQWGSFWPYPDSPGFLKVTMLSGSVEFQGFSIEQVVGGGFYSDTFVVPEPGVGIMLAVGLGLFCVFRKCGSAVS